MQLNEAANNDRLVLDDLISDLAALDFGDMILVGSLKNPALNKLSSARLAVAKVISWVFIDDMALNEKIYDSERFGFLSSILGMLAGWDSHKIKNDLQAAKTIRSRNPEFRLSKTLPKLILPNQKQVIRKLIDEALCLNHASDDFQKYFRDRLILDLSLPHA